MRRAALIGLEYLFEFGFYFSEYRYLLCHICCIAALHRWLSGFIETLTTGKHLQLSEYNVIILFYFLLHRSIANWIAANVNNSPSCKTDALKTICVPRWAVTSWLWRCPQSLRICAFFILHLNDKQVNFVHDFFNYLFKWLVFYEILFLFRLQKESREMSVRYSDGLLFYGKDFTVFVIVRIQRRLTALYLNIHSHNTGDTEMVAQCFCIFETMGDLSRSIVGKNNWTKKL